MAIIATAGAADANSYLTMDEFNAYLAARLNLPVKAASASPAMKEAALIQATMLFDSQLCFTGAVATSTQALMFPRLGLLARNGNVLSSTIVPREVKNAVAELAISLLVSDRTAENAIAAKGITSLRAGPVTLTFKDEIASTVIPTFVRSLLVSTWLCPPDTTYASLEML